MATRNRGERGQRGGGRGARTGRGPAESLIDDAVDALAEKVSTKVSEKIAQQEQKLAAKAAKHAESLDRLAAHLGALDVWTRAETASRRPRFSREQLADAAVRIADAEGFDALSMRRLAAELDAGTMTLYHYVRTKDELLTLVTDAVMGEVVVPASERMPTNWREALAVVAERTRASFRRHPWMFDITDDPPIGPNSVRHFDQSLQAVASLDLPLAAKLDIVAAVDEYVFGYCLQERNRATTDDPGFSDDMVDYVNGLIETGDYPQLETLAGELGLDRLWTEVATSLNDDGRFRRNLDRLLDGIAASLL